MTSAQRVIKGLAIALATFIIFLIASSILGVLNIFFGVFNTFEMEGNTNYKESTFKVQHHVKNLDIDLGSTDLEIVRGDELLIKSSRDKYIKITENNNSVKIRNRNSFFWSGKNNHVKITIPENNLDNLELDIGAGHLLIDDLDISSLDLDQGAGQVTIKNSNFLKTDIDGGAGRIEIENCTLNNLKLDTGVGSTVINNSSILGVSDISTGVGSLSISLNEKRDDYKIIADKGLGELKVDGENFDGEIGTGQNQIKIDGGVGSIRIDFANTN